MKTNGCEHKICFLWSLGVVKDGRSQRLSIPTLPELFICVVKSQTTNMRILCSQEKGSLLFAIITTKTVKFTALFDHCYIHSNTVSMTAGILFSVFTTLSIIQRTHLALKLLP